MLYHWRKRPQPGEGPNARVGDRVPVEVIDHNAEPAHALHLAQEGVGLRSVEVVQKEGGVGYVERVVWVGEVEGVSDFEAGLGPLFWREHGVEPCAAVAHGDWVEVQPGRTHDAAGRLAPVDELGQIIGSAASHIQDVKARVRVEEGG